MKRILNALILVVLAAAVIALLTMWLRPTPARVDTAKASRGPMQVTVDGEGKTRVRDRYVVATPVAGQLRRIPLRRGDVVKRGQVIAQIDPLPLAPLDPRQRAEAVARVSAAEDAKREVDRMIDRSKAIYDQALRECDRCEQLVSSGVVARQELERAQTAVTTSFREYEAATSKAASAAHEVEAAAAALLALSQGQRPAAPAVKVQSPISGKVLSVLEESERVVTAGAPLLELSSPAKLEVVIELLSTDAVKISPGALVMIEGWGGPEALEARVRLIEPSAFTKVSALGIEEQRVNVVADLTTPSTVLGDGYRVDGRIVVWSAGDVLKVPVSALFRRGESWSLFVVENGEAQLRDVEVGQRTSFEAEIKAGLEPGTEVIVHPSNQIADGTRVVSGTSIASR
ncbi:MAG TPA: HlyD family efflux transporter periplasmic adaptor subunit [Pyrinomonadaceae bacterium]|nr:HlyD family efflux transporter periplasmic adaptor subunit [Pyrinomonadaceae bacterium]